MSSIKKYLKTTLPPSALRFIQVKIMPLFRRYMRYVRQRKKSGLIRKVASNPDSATTLMDLGKNCFQLNQIEEGIDCYEKAIAINPDIFEAHSMLEMLCRYLSQEERTDSGGNRVFCSHTYDISKDSFDKLLKCCKRMVERFPDSIEANFKMANSTLMARGNRKESVYYFNRAIKKRMENARARGSIGIIYIASLHRSANGYLKRSLSSGLGVPIERVEAITSTWYWYPDCVVIPPSFALTTEPIADAIVGGHVMASEANLMSLNLSLDKLIVNVRDPRQALLSYVHYMQDHFRNTNNIVGVLQAQIPEDYFLFSLTDKINWQIENFYLPTAIKWIEGWLDAEENPDFHPEIIFTTQENLVADPKGYFEKILDFYKIDKGRFKFPQPPSFKQKTPMRKGGVNEWQEVFTPEQIEKATSMIPERFFQRFGWSRSEQLINK